MTEAVVKMGPKGQVLIIKELREKVGLRPGQLAETILYAKGVLIRPVSLEKELGDVRRIRQSISKKWPKGLDCIEAVREQRE